MKTSLYSLFVIIVAVCCCAVGCNSQQRTLTFATGWKHASLTIYDSPKPFDRIPGILVFPESGKTIGVAEGKISVPKVAFVGVEINAVEGYEHFLSQLPDDGIQRIDLLNAELTNATFKHIERVRSLRQVNMVNCTANNVDATLLNGLPRMQYLDCRLRNESPETHRTIAAWASKSRQLQFYNDDADDAHLSLEEIRRFASHEAPLFCTVVFGRDADAVIDALATIPHLVGLNVHVSDDVPEGYHRSLAKLKHLRLANWSGGILDEDFLRSMAKVDNLSTFRVQGDARVTDSFIENLPQLKNIEEISFNDLLSDHQSQILPNFILGMENICDLPELTNVSAELLAELCERDAIRTLSISGLNDSASPKQLAEVIKRNSRITSLSLKDIEWTSEIAKAICCCENLSDLSLDVGDFDGRLFPSVERMRALNSIFLTVRGRAAGLSVFGQFPNLEMITVYGSTFDANHWSFVADCKSLQSLTVRSGQCDDSIVNWIKRNKSLRRFSMSQSGVMTDAGVTELGQCEHLESLAIEGFITARAISTLKALPKLRELSVCTDMLHDDDKRRLESEFSQLESFSLRDFHSELGGKITIGDDRIYRQVPAGGRDRLDALEGVSLKEMLGDFVTADLHKRLDGKIVLVEFWGTWCGPCLAFIPELERLHKEFGELGFEILAIHAKTGSETVESYLKKNPKRWPNLIDKDGKLQESFAVPSYPSIYIFGSDGKMRVALPFRQTLSQSLELLLKDSR